MVPQLEEKSMIRSALNFVMIASASLLMLPTAQAAPIPGTGSSALVAPQLGLYRSPAGFEIQAANSGWKQAQAPQGNKFVATLYRAPATGNLKDSKAALTVRVDKLAHAITIDQYIKRWQKEYPKYGFDLLGAQPFNQNKNTRGYVMDLINRDNKTQIRQVVFLKQKNAVILTCRDQEKTFKNALKGCNQIVHSFQWTE
jgi:hypothetical protein